ncbi:hypothetical protein [Paenibacillus sp. IHBB 10380]|uniref:hypothetical protein n=1 Tax=Paenibacillus sp. IHBB 10380 TaxID=1566358 RepID=UPI0005CFAC6E|nr:hypothetical protein [Paenibacillus sp. IHBB 10380]AJS59246.1 hypothetical protein UB51_13095 [Paenibacillus sp. IHBB 10380]
MTWFRRIIDEDNMSGNSEYDFSEVRMDKILNKNINFSLENIDTITLFFLTSCYLNNNDHLQISVVDTEKAEIVVNKFLIYFEYAFKVYEDSQIKRIVFKKLDTRLINYFSRVNSKEKIDPLIYDLYYRNSFKKSSFTKVYEYEIIPDAYLAYSRQSKFTDASLWDFLNKTLIDADGAVNFVPIGWKLNNSLLESPSLHYFVVHANKVEILANNDNDIAYIRLK